MGLNTALNTGLTGLTANSLKMSVTGDNIANAETLAFKGSRVDFETLLSRTTISGSAPTAQHGGTNPSQVGSGTTTRTSRDFSDGTVQATGKRTDMAIEGSGFFILKQGGQISYTRAGNFELDRDAVLVNPNGGRVQGYAIDDHFNIQQGVLTDLTVPLGSLTAAEQTNRIAFEGNLDASGDVATQGSVTQTSILHDGNGGPEADANTLLTDLFAAGGVDPLFQDGDVITFSGAEIGGKSVSAKTFHVGPVNATGSDAAGTTYGELAAFIEGALGIQPDGVGGVDVQNGQLIIAGNLGEKNDIVIHTENFSVNAAMGSPTNPLAFDKIQSADGESVTTTVAAYDSLGNNLEIDITMVMVNKDNAGTQWRFFAHSNHHQDASRSVGTGLLQFDTSGRFVSADNNTIELSRDGTGAATPQTLTLSFAGGSDSLSALADSGSGLTAESQDGSPKGTLEDFSIDHNGTIHGVFSNGLSRPLGRIPLAQFANNEGLEDIGGNMYRPTANSGAPQVVEAGRGGTGRIVGRALEMSNVDLAEQFTNLITAQTGFSAASRVLTTSDQLLQELMNIGRR